MCLSPQELGALTNDDLLERRRLLNLQRGRTACLPDRQAALIQGDGLRKCSPEWRLAHAQIDELLELRYAQGRALPHIHLEGLFQMGTRRLLARLDSLRKCNEFVEQSDYCPKVVEKVVGILFKDSDEWRRAYEDVKGVLSGREHVPRGAERKRQAAAGTSMERRRCRARVGGYRG